MWTQLLYKPETAQKYLLIKITFASYVTVWLKAWGNTKDALATAQQLSDACEFMYGQPSVCPVRDGRTAICKLVSWVLAYGRRQKASLLLLSWLQIKILLRHCLRWHILGWHILASYSVLFFSVIINFFIMVLILLTHAGHNIIF
jgi:hypothetical protein